MPMAVPAKDKLGAHSSEMGTKCWSGSIGGWITAIASLSERAPYGSRMSSAQMFKAQALCSHGLTASR